MQASKRVLLGLVAAGAFLFGTSLFASPTVIYIHGFNPNPFSNNTSACQGQSSCPYWGTQDTSGRKVVHVGYDGRYNPLNFGSDRGVTRLLQTLNNECRRSRGQSCIIINHSMGGLTTSYVVANYNRYNTYNILYVSSLVSAEGGSELADIGDPILRTLNFFTLGATDFFLASADAVRILRTSAARGAFDHNRNNGVIFYHIAGDTPFPWYLGYLNWIFPGDHDSVVAMHSTCAYRNIEDFGQCGGQSITSGMWWWKKTTHYVPWTGHYAHPGHDRRGVNTKHTAFPDHAKYTRSSIW